MPAAAGTQGPIGRPPSMPSSPNTRMLPETDRDTLERFSVAEPTLIRRVLDDLLQARATVTLFAAHDFDAFVVSRLLARESDLLRFDFVDDEARSAPLLRGNAVVAVALLERIKIQFEAGQPRCLRPDGAPELHCALPPRLIRIQRREAFRVRPPDRDPVLCVLREPMGTERRYRVSDISATGIGLTVPAGDTPPQPGEIWHHCRLEIPGLAPIPCDLEVRTHAPAAGDATRVGCGFHRPTPESQRAVQCYVMDVERGRVPGPPPVKPACS